MRSFSLLLLAAVLLPLASGCSLLLPRTAHQPVIRNPFPQLSRVAIAPFFNQSDEPTVDGRQVAMAYYAELQSTPGFEVVPLGVVEEAIIAHRVDLNGPGEARRLAKILGVDAVVVGAVTDFSEYYPPRVGLRVEWYSANQGFHEIPAGYGLPWGTPEEEFIPDNLVYESQMALARAEMAPLSPACEQECQPLPDPPALLPATPETAFEPEGATEAAETVAPTEDAAGSPDGTAAEDTAPAEESTFEETPSADESEPAPDQSTIELRDYDIQLAQNTEELPPGEASQSDAIGAIDQDAASDDGGAVAPLAPEWPHAASAPCQTLPHVPPARPACRPFNGPVLSHTRIYSGNDADVTQALEGYTFFRDDMRFGGWQSTLSRSDEFVRFCCRMHISEMLSARGGARKTRVLWRWPESR